MVKHTDTSQGRHARTDTQYSCACTLAHPATTHAGAFSQLIFSAWTRRRSVILRVRGARAHPCRAALGRELGRMIMPARARAAARARAHQRRSQTTKLGSTRWNIRTGTAKTLRRPCGGARAVQWCRVVRRRRSDAPQNKKGPSRAPHTHAPTSQHYTRVHPAAAAPPAAPYARTHVAFETGASCQLSIRLFASAPASFNVL